MASCTQYAQLCYAERNLILRAGEASSATDSVVKSNERQARRRMCKYRVSHSVDAASWSTLPALGGSFIGELDERQLDSRIP